jgi:CHASE2 domain-containing sensor protein
LLPTATFLASERTYAAWVRTGLLALAGGIGARALKDVPNWLVLANGTLLIGFSLFCFGAAVWRHFHPGPPPPPPSVKVHALAGAGGRERRTLHDRGWRVGGALVDAAAKLSLAD